MIKTPTLGARRGNDKRSPRHGQPSAKVLGKIGAGVHFEPTFRCGFGYNITIGNNFYACRRSLLRQAGTLGNNVWVGGGGLAGRPNTDRSEERARRLSICPYRVPTG